MSIGDLPQERQEADARTPYAVARWKIRAAEEYLAIGGQPDGHRPTATAGQQHHRLKVCRVDVRARFAIDLDGYVVGIESRSDLLVLERLLLHHVAPMTRRIADAHENRLPFRLRAGERLVAPRVPVDRVVRMLTEIGASLEDQTIGEPRAAVRAHMAGPGPIPGTELGNGRAEARDELRGP